MKLTKTGVNNNVDNIVVQVSLNDIQNVIKDTHDAQRSSERIVKASLDISAHAGILTGQTSKALYGNQDIDPVTFFKSSKEIIKGLAQLAIGLGYDLDDIGVSILKDVKKDA